ncbi:MAG: thioredoxin-disulfide reductase [Candidatus Comchoanobacterales bacterium]
MVDQTTHQLIIIGSGPAGYSAAVYAARAGLSPLMLTGYDVGGQLMTTTDVENWIGDPSGLTGPLLMDRMKEHAEAMGVTMKQEHVNKVDFSQRPFQLTTDNASYLANSIIISTGATAKYLGLDSEKQYMGKGVSACATCDGFFFRNEDVAVVGGGNTAFEEAIYLSNLCRTVTLVHRRDVFRAEHVLQQRLDQLVEQGKIRKMINYTVDQFIGDEQQLKSLQLKHSVSGALEDLPVTGAFIAIGHKPNTGIFEGQLTMHNGYIQVKSGLDGMATETSVPGVFAAGDVSDHVYRQAITSAGTGCMAALDAERFLSSH